jgi:benzoate membrane transport protein
MRSPASPSISPLPRSWILIVWLTSAAASIAAAFYYRVPIPITWTIPGIIYLGALAGRFSYAEIVGANLLAGILITLMGALGIGKRIMTWLPLPIVMGMFAGSILEYATRLVAATVEDLGIVGTCVLCYLGGRLVGDPRLPPVGLAAVGGAVAIALSGPAALGEIDWSAPHLVIPDMRFGAAAFAAISLPMIVLSMGLGNVQGLGFLQAQGYKVAVSPISVLVGIASVISALLTLAIAFAGATIGALVGVLPRSYVFALAGLAILGALQDSLEKSFSGALRFGALVAFIVALTPFAVLGISSAFWSLVAGLVASALIERAELLKHWRS